MASGDRNTAIVPMRNAANRVAMVMCICIVLPLVSISRNECPAAAVSAQYIYALFGGLLMDAKPIAAIAANNAS